jgi:hypothetical protein
MRNTSEYQKRAEECIRKAETVPNPADRAGWLKLAADWTALGFRSTLSLMPSGALVERRKEITRGQLLD